MRVIAIAGLTCSGKTTLAEEISRRLDAPILALDDYYLPLSELSFEERTRCNFDSPHLFDHGLLHAHLSRLKKGEAIEKPVYDFVEFTRATETQVVTPSPIVVLEGLYALFWEEINAFSPVRVFLDVEPDICLNRRIERDVERRGRTPEEVRWRFARHVTPMYEKHVYPTHRYATHHVRGVEELGALTDRVLVEAL